MKSTITIFFTTIIPLLSKFIKYDKYDKYYSLYINDESKKIIAIILMSCSLCLTFFSIINIKRNISILKTYFFINIMNLIISILYIIYKKNISMPDVGCLFIIVLNIIYIYIN